MIFATTNAGSDIFKSMGEFSIKETKDMSDEQLLQLWDDTEEQVKTAVCRPMTRQIAWLLRPQPVTAPAGVSPEQGLPERVPAGRAPLQDVLPERETPRTTPAQASVPAPKRGPAQKNTPVPGSTPATASKYRRATDRKPVIEIGRASCRERV